MIVQVQKKFYIKTSTRFNKIEKTGYGVQIKQGSL